LDSSPDLNQPFALCHTPFSAFIPPASWRAFCGFLVKIHFQVVGEGTPTVLLHGLFASWGDWYEAGYVTALKDHHQLLLVDARGHGASDKPHEPEAYSMEAMVSDLVAVMDAANVPQAHFLGYSWGGCIGYGIEQYAPDRFHSVMIGGHAPQPGHSEVVAFFVQPLQAGVEAFATLLDQIFEPSHTGYKPRRLSGDFEAYIAATLAWRDYSGLEAWFLNMTMPSLVYMGDQDGGYDVLKATLPEKPDSQRVILPGLDHVQAFLRSELVLPHLDMFLRRVRQT
jgi:pimeloyl-ACP methyl ester carboxylesterase